MPGPVDIYYTPSITSAPTPTNAIDHQTFEYSERQARDCSAVSLDSKRSARQPGGRRLSIVSQGPPPVLSAVADSTFALGPRVEVKPNGRNEVITFASRYSSSPPSSLPGVVKISERRNSIRRPKKQSSLSSSDEGERFSGSDTSSEAGSA